MTRAASQPFSFYTLINTTMKISEILSEDAYSPKAIARYGDVDREKIAEFIKTNCKEWLAATKQGREVVYRGFQKNPKSVAFRKKVRTNRKPLNSNMQDHLNLEFMINYAGKTANRGNSIFVSGCRGIASAYGEVFVVMPIGKFNYTWHEWFEDWFIDTKGRNILTHKTGEPKKSKFTKFVDKMLNIPDYKEAGPEWNAYIDSEDDLDKEQLQYFIDALHGDDGSLIKAIRKKHEIMIACDEILAVSLGTYESLLHMLR